MTLQILQGVDTIDQFKILAPIALKDAYSDEVAQQALAIARKFAPETALNDIVQWSGHESVVAARRLQIDSGRLTLGRLPPPRRDWTVDHLLPAGKYCVLAGLGGVSKTWLAISWACSVALGRPWAGLDVLPGTAVLILGEEDVGEVQARFGAYCEGLGEDDRGVISQRVLAFPWAGNDMKLTTMVGRSPKETSFADDIASVAMEHSLLCGVPPRLIVIDHARLALGGDPNDAQAVTELTRVATKIAVQTGAAVLLLAHSPKSVVAAGKQNGKSKEQVVDADISNVAGSVAFVDNARSAMVLTTMSKPEAEKYGIPEASRTDYARLQLIKSNYSKQGRELWMKRQPVPGWGTAMPVPVDMAVLPKQSPDLALAERILRFIADRPGALSKTKVREYKKSLKAPEADVEAMVATLLATGKLVLRAPTDVERDTHGLSHQTKQVLDLPK